MKGTIKRKKKKFWKPVVVCFIILYLVTMWMVTLQVKRKYEDEYNHTLEEIAVSLLKKASSKEISEEQGWNDEKKREFYQNLVNEYFQSVADPSLQIAVAIYDKQMKLLAQSSEVIGDISSVDSSDVSCGPFVLDGYLTFEQKEELASYYWKTRQFMENNTEPCKYNILTQVSSDGQELYGIYVQELTWEEGEEAQSKQYEDPLTNRITSMQTGVTIDYVTGEETGNEKTFYETDSKVVWEWLNQDVNSGQREKGEIKNIGMVFPYISSYENWQRWSNSEYLHNFPKQADFSSIETEGNEYPELGIYFDWRYYRGEYRVKVGYIDDPSAYMIVRMEENIWLTAFDYLKDIYLAGILLVLVCMFVIIIAFNQVYERQMGLEETRRDFVNAMAHELKTPLGIIRNFSENLIEHNLEEKREYYLTRIIGQTEEMDHMVADMIEIEKLDSEELVLRKESVSFVELIREQMERFEPLIDEKNLQIQYQEEADFLVEGDREYLAKALWNLLSNAVDYNILDGRILVRTDAKSCYIENTGKCMEEEQLIHVFDLFYIGEKSRNRKERHMGMGLFLAKKILKLHRLNLTIENTAEGVRAVIEK